MTLPDYLTQDADGYVHLTNHRIGLQDLVHFYNEGYSPEMIAEQFPTLPLALIHKTIAFYLENESEVDATIARSEAAIEQQRANATRGPTLAELRRRLNAARRAESSPCIHGAGS